MKYDVIIIGAGPAGLTAGLYAARYNLKVLIIGKLVGGLIAAPYDVCNYPTYKKIKAIDLTKKMEEQVKALGVEIKEEEVLDVKGKDEDFEVFSNVGKFSAKKIIMATGTKRVKLNLPGEKEFVGKGVSYCAICDAGFYKNKTVGIVGGGNSAFSSAFLLAQFAKKVYIIYRRDKFFRAEAVSVKKAEKSKKVELMLDSKVTKITGKEKLEEIEINEKTKLKLDGLFVEGGTVPWDELSKKLKLKFEGNFVVVDKNQRTNIKGVFAAGDMTNNPLKQIVTACAEGAVAANSVYGELSA